QRPGYRTDVGPGADVVGLRVPGRARGEHSRGNHPLVPRHGPLMAVPLADLERKQRMNEGQTRLSFILGVSFFVKLLVVDVRLDSARHLVADAAPLAHLPPKVAAGDADEWGLDDFHAQWWQGRQSQARAQFIG